MLEAAIVGWLVSAVGGGLLRSAVGLLRGSAQDRELAEGQRQAVREIVDAQVLQDLSPGARARVESELEQRFGDVLRLPSDPEVSTSQALRMAIEAQVKPLREMYSESGQWFYDELGIDEQTLIERLYAAMLTILDRLRAREGPAGLLASLEAEEQREQLDLLIDRVDALLDSGDAVRQGYATGTFATVSADAVLRGPVAHLGLAQEIADADSARETHPAAAAAGYGRVADALEQSPYAPHAPRMRARQADALRTADESADAAKADLSVMAAALTSGEPEQTLAMARRLADQESEIPEHLIRTTNVLAAIAAYEHHHQSTLDAAADTIDATEPNDPYRLQAATLLTEHAVAAKRVDLVRDRVDLLNRVAATAGVDDADRLLDARLRACLADVEGEWGRLASVARRDYPPRIAALLQARHARHLAMTQHPEAAIERYYDAIERACQAGAYADAADWLFAVGLVQIRFDLRGDGSTDLPNRLALGVRAAGNDSVIPAPFSPRERALSRMHDAKYPDALAALHRFRWRTVVLGSWGEEQEAEHRLGMLYIQAGHPLAAIEHLISAAAVKDLKKLASQLPEEPTPLPDTQSLPSRPPWERAGAFTIAGAAADLLTDEDAERWAAASLGEITAGGQVTALITNPVLAAFKAFGQLADATTVEQAQQFVDLVDPLIERDPHRYRLTDEAHADALVRIARRHEPLRAQAVDQMCRVLIVDQKMGDIVLSRGDDSLRAERNTVEAVCGPAAEEGHIGAALALALIDSDTTPVVAIARQRLDIATQPRIHTPGQYSYSGGWQREALLATVLESADRTRFADAMAIIAADRQDVAHNRRLGLEALAAIGPRLDEPTRGRHLAVALAAARGEYDGSVDDKFFSSDPLERFRFDMGVDSLCAAGVATAAALAHTPGQYAEVVAAAQRLMPHAAPASANIIAQALAELPADEAGLDVPALAAHSSEWIRAAAAVLWCTTPGQPPDIGVRLAADPSPRVRRALARHLPQTSAHAELRATLQKDVRRSIRATSY